MNGVVEIINTAGRAFVAFALPMLIQSSLLILILLVVDAVLRKRVRAVFRYWVWMLVLVKLMLPPSLWSPVSIGTWCGATLEAPTAALLELEEPPLAPPPAPEPVSPAASILSQPRLALFEPPMPATAETMSPTVSSVDVQQEDGQEQAGTVPAKANDLAASVQSPSVALSWQGLTLVLWAAVVAALLLLLVQRAFFVRGLVAQADGAGRALLDVLQECRVRAGVRRQVSLKLSPNAVSPAVCGLVRPVILMPQNLPSRLSERDLRAVLLHELAHVKRGDLWVNLFQTLLQIVYFYHPLLWLANAALRRAREQAVDEAVLVALGKTAGQYPETLVNIAKLAFRRRPALSLRLIGVVESKSALTARIKHMLSRPLPKTARLGLVGLLIVAATAGVLLPMAGAAEEKASVETSGPLDIRLMGVCPDGGEELYDANGKKLDTTLAPPGLWDGPWEADQQRRDFVFEVPRFDGQLLFLPFPPLCPAGTNMRLGGNSMVLFDPGNGPSTMVISEQFPSAYRERWARLFAREVPIHKVDLTLRYFHGPRGAALCTFSGPFAIGKTLPADSGRPYQLTPVKWDMLGQSRIKFRFTTNQPFKEDTPVLVYDLQGRRYFVREITDRRGGGGTDLTYEGDAVPWEQISLISIGEEPHEMAFRNIKVHYPGRPQRTCPQSLDAMAQRLNLTGLEPEKLGGYRFKSLDEALAVLDVARGRWQIEKIVEACKRSRASVDFTALSPDVRDRIRRTAASWAQSSSVWVRARGVELGLMAGFAEFIDPAFALLDYRHPEDLDATHDMQYQVLSGLGGYPNGLPPADTDRLIQYALQCTDGYTWGCLFRECLRDPRHAGLSDVLWELAQDDRPWVWWPVLAQLLLRNDKRLKAHADLPERMKLRLILVDFRPVPGEELLLPKVKAMLPGLLTAETVRMCPDMASDLHRAITSDLDHKEATAVYMNFLAEVSQPTTRWRFERDHGSHHLLYSFVPNLTRDVNLWYDVNIGQLGLFEPGKINESLPSPGAIERVAAEALDWYRANPEAPINQQAPEGVMRIETPVQPASSDSDGDGLSDFQEEHKYLTDPAKTDSDGDGTPDGDWGERREYAYSVRTVLRYMPPLDEDGLNDDFQDARVLRQTGEYLEVEVVHYPLATSHESVPENRNWRQDSAGMTEYLAPGVTTNWDEQMRRDLLAALKADGIDIETLTDKQVVEQVSRWLLHRSRSLDKVFTTYYVDYPDGRPRVYPGLEDAFRREFERDSGNYDWTLEQHFDHELLGKGMFYHKTHGSCTSTAVYLTTVLRALGIPTRMILVTPAVDASDDEQIVMVNRSVTHHRVRETMLAGLRRSRSGWTNHTFNEVYVGHRWCRLDYNQLGCPILGVNRFGLQTHLYTLKDWSDVNFAPTWGRRYAKGERSDLFKYSNPYSAVEVSELFGPHGNIPNPPFTAQDLPQSSSSLPNIFILEPSRVAGRDFSIWEESLAIVREATANKTGRVHGKEHYDNLFKGVWTTRPGDILVLLFSLDTPERVPEGYEDLLPKPWPEIEATLKRGETVELGGQARDMNIILLAAPTRSGLQPLIQGSKLLHALRKDGAPPAATERVLAIGPAWEALRDELGARYHGSIGGFSTDEKRNAQYFKEMLDRTRPSDTMVLMFAFDRTAAVPASYQDLLPLPWSEIVSRVGRGERVEARGMVRGLNVVLLATLTLEQLKTLIHQTTLLDAFRTRASREGKAPAGDQGVGTAETVTGQVQFGPAVERVLGRDATYIDLERGITPSPPSDLGPGNKTQALLQWCRGNGIDAIADPAAGSLHCLDAQVVELSPDAWTSLSVEGLRQAVERGPRLASPPPVDGLPVVSLQDAGRPAATYGLRTRTGTLGLLQITDAAAPKDGGLAFVKIRYRLALAAIAENAAPEQREFWLGLRQYLDLDTGRFVDVAPEEATDPNLLMSRGVDLYLTVEPFIANGSPGTQIQSLQLQFAPAPARLYLQEISLDQVRESLQMGVAVRQLDKPQRIAFYYDAGRTYAFRTVEGTAGVLRVIWPRGMDVPRCTLQYRLIPELDIPPAEFPWGAATEGRQCRLRTPQREWRAGATVTLSLDVRNQSAEAWHFVPVAEAQCELEVDGAWYGWAETLMISAPVWTLEPGTELNDAVGIKLVDSWALPADGAPLTFAPGVASKWGARLELTPGPHTIRVRFHASENRFSPAAQGLSTVSNPVEIIILSSEQSPSGGARLESRTPRVTEPTGSGIAASAGSGPLGRCALSFDGVDDCLIVPPSPSLTVKVPFFIEVWAKPDLSMLPESRRGLIPDEEPWPEMSLIRQGRLLPETAPAQARGSHDNAPSDGVYDGWPKLRVPLAHGLNGLQVGGFMGFLSRRSGGFFAVGQDGRASQTSIFRVDPLSPDRPDWLHVYALQDYMQDQFVPSSDGPLVIGGRIVPNGIAFKGEIAEVRIWNKVLTPQEARHYAAISLSGNEPNLVACWDFERAGGGQVVYDITANQNHAHLGTSRNKDDADPKWIDLAPGTQGRPDEALREISGVVMDPNGQPVAGAQVALCTEDQGVTIAPPTLLATDFRGKTSEIVETDAEGRFVFSRVPRESLIFAAHTMGFARVESASFSAAKEVRLARWGQVEGTLYIGRKAGSDQRLTLLADLGGGPVPWPWVRYDHETTADDDGRFVFRQAIPGWVRIAHYTWTADPAAGHTNTRPIRVDPGQTLEITIGGVGRPVVGKLVVSPDVVVPADAIWGPSEMSTARPELPKPVGYDRMTPTERQEWRRQWAQTPEGREYYDALHRDLNRRDYGVPAARDGTFRIEDVIPGRYEFRVWLWKPSGQRLYARTVGPYVATIEVPPMAEAYSDEPLDLGTVTLVEDFSVDSSPASGTNDKGAGGGALAEPGNANSPSTTRATPAEGELVGQPQDALKRLIDNAQPGGVVTVPKGRYTVPVEVTKPVMLRGESQEGCVIEVTADQPAVSVNTGGKGDVTIENMTIRWQLATDKRIERPVALLVKDTNVQIRNCRFVPLGDARRSPMAVYIDGRSKSTVENCRFSGFEYVICYGSNTQGVVQDCIITDCGHQGVINYDGATLTVQRCLITGSKFHAVRCTGGTLHVKDNLLIENANRAIYLGNKTGRGTITNNLILGNGTGISGFGRANYVIANNVVVSNKYAGIDMRDSCRLSIRDNVLAKNQRGLVLFKEGTENYNVIAANVYWANATDVENLDKPAESITADPQFADPNHGDFSVGGRVREQGHGLTDPQIIKDLWLKYEQLQHERPAEAVRQTNDTLQARPLVPAPAQPQTSPTAVASPVPGPIQQRIDAAAPGATIRLEPGMYQERLVINKPLTFEGAGWDKTTIVKERMAVKSPEEIERVIAERLAGATSDAQRREVAAQVRQELAEKLSPLALTVENAQGVVIRGIKFTSPGGRIKGGSMNLPLLKLDGSRVQISDCAVVAGPGDGVHILNGSAVEIEKTLVAAVWGTGIVVGPGPSESGVRIRDCDIRNCHYAGLTIRKNGPETVVERCRIWGAAWHGIRYDDAAPRIVGNLIYGHARFGIYASGRTAATVTGNLFYANEMTGMGCWFQGQDLIEGNTFANNKGPGLSILGASKPSVRRNIFSGNPAGVSLGNVGENSPFAKSEGTVALQGNLFWLNDRELQFLHDPTTTEILDVGDDTGTVRVDPGFTAPASRDFSLRADSPARSKGIGAGDLLPFDSPWPLQPEELAIIPKGDTRDYRQWREPG